MHHVAATLFGQKYFILKTTTQKVAKPKCITPLKPVAGEDTSHGSEGSWKVVLLVSGAIINKFHNSQMKIVLELWNAEMIV